MEFEENDAKIERRSQTTFSIHFFPMLLPRILLLSHSINRISKEQFLRSRLRRHDCENVQNNSDQMEIDVQKIPRHTCAAQSVLKVNITYSLFGNALISKIVQIFQQQTANHCSYRNARRSLCRIVQLKSSLKVLPVYTLC